MKRIVAVLMLCSLFGSGSASAAPDAAPLAFRISEGRVENAFYQDGPVAAHLLLSSGAKPRVLVAFPAGNSAVGVWFEDSAGTPVQWTLDDMQGASFSDEHGRRWNGIVAEASVAAGRLLIKDAVLGSVRVLRDYQLGHPYPPETATVPKVSETAIDWQRPRVDGRTDYTLSLTLHNGKVSGGHGAPLVLAPDRPGEPLRLRIDALTTEIPLTPFAVGELLDARAGSDERSRHALQFLSYHEKFLAGSWRFDTYFGRDTLMSLRLLMAALKPGPIEAGLASVLERLSPQGEVAHEEDIGEFAVLRHRKEGAPGLGDAPIYDYKMIDGDYMLAPVAAAYLLDRREGRERAVAFLAGKAASGETLGAALVRNFAFVANAGRAFAHDPVVANLVSLKPGITVGEWRDSEAGLAGGRMPYDVNAVLVPAALGAIARFQQSGVLDPYLDEAQAQALSDAHDEATTWSKHAPPLFDVAIDAATARQDVRRYARQVGVDPATALASLPSTGDLRFDALALDAHGKPIPVLNSDGGFALLFGDPSPEALDTMVTSMLRPFPAGLLTDVGLLVANPVHADGGIQRGFGKSAYHGTVVWSWQQALLAAGVARQLRRDDLPAATRTRLRDAQQRLWKAIDATRDSRTSELWSWSYRDGRYRVEPFGQGKDDADESNAAQLWSTVYLAIPEPE